MNSRDTLLNTWVGHDVEELIMSWGPPNSTYRLESGVTIYTWVADGGVVAMPLYGSAVAVTRYCKTLFTADARDIIRTWRYEGNAC
jgi:hypothetical protein